MEKRIKRLIIGFFAVMLSLTLLSRVAASAMVAKVQVVTGKSSGLSYEIDGTGTVTENAKKYMMLQNGYKIGKVSIKEGQQVEEGDVLFAYDLDQLKATKEQLDKELKKLQLSYRKTQLSGDADMETAAQSLSDAKEDVNQAEKSIKEMKAAVRDKKKEDYKAAKSEWENLKWSREDALNTANRAIEDSEAELAELMKPQQTLEEILRDYKASVTTASEELITKDRIAIYDFYYDGDYAGHQKAVEKAQEKLQRAKDDLKKVSDKWDAAINYWDIYSPDETVKKAYDAQMAARDQEITSASRTITDLQKELNELTEKDTKLDKALSNYKSSIQQNLPSTAYDDLYKMLYDNLKVDETKIDTARIKLKRAKEDGDQTKKEWDKKVDSAYAKVEELKTDLLQIKDGTYDYEVDLKDGQTALSNAERGLKTAGYGFEKAENSSEIDLSSIEMDVNDKQEEINKVQELLNNNGKITSPVAGVILTSELEEGITLTGQEKLIISTGGFELSMKANKDEMESFAEGDEVNIKIASDQPSIIASIENIGLPDQEDNVGFTALLPDGEYESGTTLDYKLEKKSADYPMCIPIQALRQDSKSTFVLLVRESDSVLGKVQSAFRLDVNVLSQDAKTAAVEAALSEDDSVIVGSNKNITEGDRVRIAETQ